MSSNSYALKADMREKAGKGIARALRRERKVPGVIYGDGKAPVTISMPEKEVGLEYQKGQMFTTLCDLELGSDKHKVLARDIQLHPVTDQVMHIDFLRVTPKTRLNVWIPVNFIGYEDSPAAQEKGVLNIVRHEVEMSCAAMSIPDQIDIDISKVAIGDTLNFSDAVLPEGTKPVIDDRDFTLATITEPRRIEVEETPDEEGAEGAEGAEGEAAEGADGEKAADGEGGGEEKAEGDDKKE